MNQPSFGPSRAQKQQSFTFGIPTAQSYRNATETVEWAEITAADPVRYQGLMSEIALNALHRAGRPHDRQSCALCATEAQECAA